MKIRNLKKGDSRRIKVLVEKCCPYVAPYNVYAYWILENYYSSSCIVAEDDGNIVGFLSGMPSMDKGAIFIWQICVDEEYRGRGIASSLLDFLLEKANELNFNKIELSITESNNASQELFKNYLLDKHIKLIEKNRCAFGDSEEIVYEFSL